MYKTLLTTLLLGLFPSTGGLSADVSALERIVIAPPSDTLSIEGKLSASGVSIVDLQSGQNIYVRQHKVQRPMASLTKLMTALIIVENHDMNEIVTVPQNVIHAVGNKAYLPPGDRFTVGDLLSALLINSANDAALTLAQYHSGSVSAFATDMNERALKLGLTSSSFRNPSGLDDPAHWSTPQDIAWLTMFTLRYEEIAARLGRSGAKIASIGTDDDPISLYHTHALLHSENPVIAGKTGTTTEAGQCLMSIIKVDGRDLLVILLNSNQRYKDMQTILAALDDTPDSIAKEDNNEL